MSKVGEMLRQAREAQNMTLNDVAEITKIRSDHLRALEDGRFEIFMAPVYIKGFIRSYAIAVKLDPQKVLPLVDDELRQIEKFKDSPSLSGRKKTALDWLMYQLSRIHWEIVLPVLGIILLLLISYRIYIAYQQYKSRDVFSEYGINTYQPKPEKFELYLPVPTNPPQ